MSYIVQVLPFIWIGTLNIVTTGSWLVPLALIHLSILRQIMAYISTVGNNPYSLWLKV
jgi:hypothetical protein